MFFLFRLFGLRLDSCFLSPSSASSFVGLGLFFFCAAAHHTTRGADDPSSHEAYPRVIEPALRPSEGQGSAIARGGWTPQGHSRPLFPGKATNDGPSGQLPPGIFGDVLGWLNSKVSAVFFLIREWPTCGVG